MNGASAADAALATLRGDVIDIVLGSVFVSIGATAITIATIRWRRGARILVWWGIWSAMYGLQTLTRPATIRAVAPGVLRSAIPYISTAIMYLLLVSAFFAWRELSVGKLRRLIDVEIVIGLAIALAGMVTFLLGGPRDRWMFYNNLLAVVGIFLLVPIVLIPKLSRFLVIQNHRVLAAGTVIFALEALYTNLSTVLRYQPLPLVDSLGFAALLFSLGYVALEIVFTNERRLLAIETELDNRPADPGFHSSRRRARSGEPSHCRFVPSDDRGRGRFLSIRQDRQSPSGHPGGRRVWSRHPGGADFFDDQNDNESAKGMREEPRRSSGI